LPADDDEPTPLLTNIFLFGLFFVFIQFWDLLFGGMAVVKIIRESRIQAIKAMR
jgi:hypothetical protein